jgi:hypothetical protein
LEFLISELYLLVIVLIKNNIMKILSFLMVLLMLGFLSETKAQCISGDCKNGVGEYKGNNGSYKGEFKNGLKHGTGTYYYNNGDKYIGEWENDKKHGNGTYYFSSGAKYKGEFENDQRNGYGDYTYKDGTVKSGKWVNNECKECFTEKPKNSNNKQYKNNNNSGPPKQPKPVGTNPTVTPGRY